MRQTELKLSKREREAVQEFRSKGERMAREINRAHILWALDRKIPEHQIMEVLGVGRTAIWRTRAAYLEGGLEFALHDVARPGKPQQYRAEAQAEVAAKTLADKLLQGALTDGFTARDVYRKSWSMLTDPKEAAEALEILIDSGWLRAQNDKAYSADGRPTVRYLINPSLKQAA